MSFDVAFGQYYEGDSFIHRLDPRFKLIVTVLSIVVIFLAKNVLAFAFLLFCVAVLIASSRIPLRIILRGMKSLLFIIFFTALLNIFWFKGDKLIFEFYIIRIYLEGIINSVLIVFRIAMLLVVTSVLLTYTTTPLGLTDGLEQLLSPLSKIGLPVHDFSMMMTIALRFIPTLVEETTKIMNAQTARGASFTEGNILRRAKSLIPVLIPLLVSSFRRAADLANAMECRCYTGGEGRTRMNVLHFGARDVVFLASVIIIGGMVVFINMIGVGYNLSL